MTTNDRLPVGTVIADYKRQIAELSDQLTEARAKNGTKQAHIDRLANNNLDLIAKVDRLKSAISKIQEMASEDIGDGRAEGTNLYQIEANARAALK
jgi:hypothetical protein